MTDLTDLQTNWNAAHNHVQTRAVDTYDGESDELRAQVIRDAQALFFDASGELDEMNVEIAHGMGDPRPTVRHGRLFIPIPSGVDESGNVIMEDVEIEPRNEGDEDD